VTDDWNSIDDDADEAVPAASTSPLARARDQRKQALAKGLYLDLKIPRYDETLVGRFKPVGNRVITAAHKRMEASKDPDREAIANAAIMSHGVVGFFDPEHPDKIADVSEVRDMLDLPADATAIDILRALFYTDGDLIAVAGKLAEWSGFSEQAAEEYQQGN
jgi:hypothetical protein